MEKCVAGCKYFEDGIVHHHKDCSLPSHAVLGDGWRDARKELPDESGDCIVYTDDKRIEIDEYTTQFGWYIDRVGGKVIAWMPLPIPPTLPIPKPEVE